MSKDIEMPCWAVIAPNRTPLLWTVEDTEFDCIRRFIGEKGTGSRWLSLMNEGYFAAEIIVKYEGKKDVE